MMIAQMEQKMETGKVATGPDESQVTVHESGGASLVGQDALNWLRAITLRASLKLYAKAKIVPTRGVTATMMLTMATEYTGKKYKRGEHQKAAADMHVWIETMRAALPIEHQKGNK